MRIEIAERGQVSDLTTFSQACFSLVEALKVLILQIDFWTASLRRIAGWTLRIEGVNAVLVATLVWTQME